MRQIEWYEYNETVTHPITIIILIISIIWIIFSDKKYLLIAFLFIAFFVAYRHRIVLWGLDFPYMRLLFFSAIIRFVLKNDSKIIYLTKIDKLIILYAVSSFLSYVLLWNTFSAVLNRIGFIIDTAGIYFVVRLYVRNHEAIEILFKTIFYFTIILSFFILYEYYTHTNPFGTLGGIRETVVIREDSIRAQGSFSHAILTGTFGSTIIILVLGFWHSNIQINNATLFLSLCAGVVITYASGSSGPILTLFGGLFALWSWRIQHRISTLLLLTVMTLIGLHFSMNAPVWHLISRIDITGGSTGYHRYKLIDSAINRFTEWLLFGVKTTSHWGWGLQDITNMYILQAVRGGFTTFILFFAILWTSFNEIINRYRNTDNIPHKHFIWGIGSCLFAHTVSFIGVSYFGQMVFFFFLLIGIIGSIAEDSALVSVNKNKEDKIYFSLSSMKTS